MGCCVAGIVIEGDFVGSEPKDAKTSSLLVLSFFDGSQFFPAFV